MEKIRASAIKSKKNAPSVAQAIIDSDYLYNKYFVEAPDGEDRLWKVVHELPKLSSTKNTIYVRCWFPSLNVLITVDFLKMAQFADDFEMVALSAFVMLNERGIQEEAQGKGKNHLE